MSLPLAAMNPTAAGSCSISCVNFEIYGVVPTTAHKLVKRRGLGTKLIVYNLNFQGTYCGYYSLGTMSSGH